MEDTSRACSAGKRRPKLCVPQTSFERCVLYYWSDPDWDDCVRFRKVAENILVPHSEKSTLQWRSSNTEVYMPGSAFTTQALIDIYTGHRHGAAQCNSILPCGLAFS